MSRGKGAFARLLSSLPHYSIMMACGVCRTPFALIASAFSPPRCSLARFGHRLLSCSLSPSLSLLSPLSSLLSNLLFFPRSCSFLFRLSLFLARLSPMLSTRHISVAPANVLCASFVLLVARTSSLARRFQPSTRTHRRDDDVRDITPAGERESLKVQRRRRSA